MKWTKPLSANPPKPTAGRAEKTGRGINRRADGAMTNKPVSTPAGAAEVVTAAGGHSKPDPTKAVKAKKPGAETFPLGLAESVRRNDGEDKPQPAPPNVGLGSVAKIAIPPILLEGDELRPAPGIGQKFSTGPTADAARTETSPGELPEAYGTGRLLLTARDPYCLYVHWDFTGEQQRRYRELSPDHRLVLRIHQERLEGPVAAELDTHPESRYAFIRVASPGGKYVAELGYYATGGLWKSITASDPTVAPMDLVADQQSVRFATLTFAPPIPSNAAPAQPNHNSPAATAVGMSRAGKPSSDVPLSEPHLTVGARYSASEPGQPGPVPGRRRYTIGVGEPEPVFPDQAPFEKQAVNCEISPSAPSPVSVPEWTLEQELALAELIDWHLMRHEWLGSAEIEDLIRAKIRRAGISLPGVLSPVPAAAMPALISSVGMAEARPLENRGFWLNVNAELVIYGATEPDAKVAIGGRPIRLRPDGTFSYRFALPDGSYQLPVTAVSPEGEVRQAELDFYRGTAYAGEVGSHPQDPALKAPVAENID